MRWLTVGLAGLAVLGWIGACSDPPANFHSYRLMSMGTWVDVAWEGPAKLNGRYPEQALETRLRTFERQFYPWADGELAALNAAIALGERFELSLELEHLLIMGKLFYQHSGGNFDPGVGALVAAWGFGASDQQHIEQIPALKPAASISGLTIENHIASSANTALVIDLGGYAKGQAVDDSMALLASLGIHNAMVNAGGDLRVSGSRNGRPWRVGIQHPRISTATIGNIWLRSGEAAFTSGDYARTHEADGRSGHHLIDPLSGAPTRHTQAVTVIADNGLLADASATAIFIAGPDRWQQVADDMGVSRVLRITATGQVQLTAAMAERFEAAGDLQASVILPRIH